MAKDKKKDKKKAKKGKSAKLAELEGKARKDGKKAKAKLDERTAKVADALKAEVQKAGAALSGAKETIAKTASAVVKQDVPATGAKHSSTAKLETFEMPSEETLFNLANLYKIFSDPTRLKILFSLVNGPRCVADISQAAGVTQGATSHQLRSMKQERLVDFERDGKQVFYSLSDNRVQTLLAQGLSYIGE